MIRAGNTYLCPRQGVIVGEAGLWRNDGYVNVANSSSCLSPREQCSKRREG